jgi:molybdenum-dependent DNA-binding transcriptional regulator ModE
MEESQLLKLKAKYLKDKNMQKIEKILINQGPISITDIKKKIGLSYSYTWDLINYLKKLDKVVTYKEHNKKGQPVMARAIVAEFVQENIKTVHKVMVATIKEKKKFWVNKPLKEVEGINMEVLNKTNKAILLALLRSPEVWNKYKIIIKPKN